MSREVISIYKSSIKAEAYIYMKKSDKFDDLPDALRQLFGRPILVTNMLITPDKKLARAKAENVLAQIAEQGFYLQMPPPKEDHMLDLLLDKKKES